MADALSSFGKTAQGLARNPLGIIALFIVLIYGFASLVLGFSGNIGADERVPITWFLVLFPVLVLAVFAWLVSQHHTKLYASTPILPLANAFNAEELAGVGYTTEVKIDGAIGRRNTCPTPELSL